MPAKVETEKCDGCGTCVDTCPTNVITIQESKAVISEEECVDCAACVEGCPNGAIICD